MKLRDAIAIPGLGAFTFEVHFQPKVHLSQRSTVAGYESLLRLRSAEGAFITPGAVFGAVDRRPEEERLALRRVLTLATLRHARRAATILKASVAINIDPFMLADPVVLSEVTAHPSPNPTVILEIVESATNVSLSLLAEGAQLVRAAGYRISLDDFGMAESNMIRLARLPVDEVKVEATLLDYQRGRQLLPHIVRAIHELGAEACIEGVETESHHEIACASGASLGQGYFYGPPAPIKGA